MAELKKLTVSDVVGREFLGKTVRDVQWLPDGSAFTFIKTNYQTGSQDIYRHNVETHEETLILDGSFLSCDGQLVEMSGYKTTDQQNNLLITGAQKQIWRHSYSAPYYIFDITTKELVPLANSDPNLQNVEFSPDNKKVAFVKSCNLYVSVGGDVRQLTFDGNDNILNGIFDWVYEEEFCRADAFRWSPDSTKIAFWWTDQTRVKSFSLMDDTSNRYPEITSLKYPKVGEQNAIVKIGVVDINTGKITWVKIGQEQDDDFYIPRIDWTTSSSVLSIQKLNRKQNHLELLFADINSDGATKVILTDKDSGWIDITDDFIFFKKKDEFLWTSEKSGYRHIYHCDYSGKELRQITSGDWEVSQTIGFDEDSGWIYFYGKKHGIENQVIYRTSLDGTNLEVISETTGWNEAKFSPNFKHYVCTRSTGNTPDQVFLYTGNGKKTFVIEENKIPAMLTFNLNFPTFDMISIKDCPEKLSSFSLKPKNFNPSKKYPVLVFGYSGPASQV